MDDRSIQIVKLLVEVRTLNFRENFLFFTRMVPKAIWSRHGDSDFI